MSLQEKLEQANKKAEDQVAERRRKVIKGAHLTEKFVSMAKDAGCDIRENHGFHVIVGKAGKSLRIYVAKRGGIVDLLGFSVQDPAVRQISKVEAQEKHMGRVQGRLEMERTDEEILSAFALALGVINVPATEVAPKQKRERKAKNSETAVTATPEATDEVQPSA